MSALQQQVRESQLVLLVDDDVMVTEGLAAGLERENRTIITCNDFESAQLMVERATPSHIVSDIQISGPFGVEGLDLIRHAKRYSPESRVIVMSGDAPEALQMEASERGAVAFLRKPFEVEELESMIDLMACSPLTAAAQQTSVIRIPLLEEIISSNSLYSVYQPIIALDSNYQHMGYEALARYRSDSLMRNPDMLFDYAARKKRLCDLEVACLKVSLRDGMELSGLGLLFLNVHPEVLANHGRRLQETVTLEAQRAGVPFERIVLEITEQTSLPDKPSILRTVGELQKLGVRFAFDDVGIAYSHLPFLGKIRPSFLKISQHFGTDFETDSTKMKIVMNLLSLAREFHCEPILEGIETASTAQAAIDLGIPFGQGFFFSRPAEASAFL
jgi:EAL domain-containing protein (putative c-di-GMP-specific phosphodiesterase class I)/ActR/RegA family two-component response regulator